MSTYNLGFYEEINKIIPLLSSNMHLISSFGFILPGLTAEGIYRIPGNKAQVDLLTSKYTEGRELVNTVGRVLLD